MRAIRHFFGRLAGGHREWYADEDAIVMKENGAFTWAYARCDACGYVRHSSGLLKAQESITFMAVIPNEYVESFTIDPERNGQ